MGKQLLSSAFELPRVEHGSSISPPSQFGFWPVVGFSYFINVVIEWHVSVKTYNTSADELTVSDQGVNKLNNIYVVNFLRLREYQKRRNSILGGSSFMSLFLQGLGAYLFRCLPFTLLSHIQDCRVNFFRVADRYYSDDRQLAIVSVKMVVNREFWKKWFKWQGAYGGKEQEQVLGELPQFILTEFWGSIVTVCARYWRYDLINAKAVLYQCFNISTLIFSIWSFPLRSVQII